MDIGQKDHDVLGGSLGQCNVDLFADITDGTNNNLLSIDCVTKTFCIGVGYGVPDGAHFESVVEQWDGTAWSLVPEASQVGDLISVSCSSVSSCQAVGTNYFSGVTPETSLLES